MDYQHLNLLYAGKCSCCLTEVLHSLFLDILFVHNLLPHNVKMSVLHIACFCITLSEAKITVVLIKSICLLTYLLFFPLSFVHECLLDLGYLENNLAMVSVK